MLWILMFGDMQKCLKPSSRQRNLEMSVSCTRQGILVLLSFYLMGPTAFCTRLCPFAFVSVLCLNRYISGAFDFSYLVAAPLNALI